MLRPERVGNALNRAPIARRLFGLRRWAAPNEGTAAMEFALLVPFMIYMFLCATDVARALTVSRRLTNAADTIAQLVSQATSASTTSGNTVRGTVSDSDVDLAFQSIVTTFPDVLNDADGRSVNWQTIIQPIVSSVSFGAPGGTCTASVPLTAVCTTAAVKWSAGYNTSTLTPYYRACAAVTAAPDGNAPSLTTIPAGFFTASGSSATEGYSGNLIVADIIYTYRPLFTAWIVGPITFQRTAYLSPRFFTQLAYSGTPGGTLSTIIGCAV